MTRICTKCGYENDDSFNFCAKIRYFTKHALTCRHN